MFNLSQKTNNKFFKEYLRNNLEFEDEETSTVQNYVKKLENGFWVGGESSLSSLLNSFNLDLNGPNLDLVYKHCYDDEEKTMHEDFIYKERGRQSYFFVKSIVTDISVNLTIPIEGSSSVETIPLYFYGIKVTSIKSIDPYGEEDELDIKTVSKLVHTNENSLDNLLNNEKFILDYISRERMLKQTYGGGTYTPYSKISKSSHIYQ